MVLTRVELKQQRGFTLLELVVAMAIAAIVGALAYSFHHDFGKTLRQAWQRSQQRQAELAWTGTVTRGLLEGQGLVEVSSQSVAFLSRDNRIMRLEKKGEDSAQWNGKPSPIPMAELDIRVEGPDCADTTFVGDPGCRALLDTLDSNRDGRLTLDEMDRDRDGMVKGRECRYVRVVELRWRATPDGFWRVLDLHPRRRVLADTGQAGNF